MGTNNKAHNANLVEFIDLRIGQLLREQTLFSQKPPLNKDGIRVADATARTQKQLKRRDERILRLVKECLVVMPDGFKFSAKGMETFLMLTEPTEAVRVVFEEGEYFMDVMKKFPKCSFNDLQDKAAAKGLKIGDDGKFVKA